jgi:hypothetical protein
MSRKMILTGLYLGLTVGAVLVGAYSSWAQEKPPAKTPVPIKPLPPAKPIEPLKPHEPAKPRAADKTPDAGQPTVMGSMPDDATRAALAKKVELDFADVPLQKIVDALAAQTKLEIMVAAKDSAAPETAPKQNLTVHLKGISASSALDLIARDLGWTWFADEGAVVITNDDRLPSVAQVYNVRDLVLAHPNSTGHEDETLDYDYSSLAEVITGAISSPNWSSDANVLQDCSPFHGTFTLAQDQKVQGQVAALLAALRKSRDLKPQQYDASVNAGLGISPTDEAAIDKALSKEVSAQPTAAKLDDLAEWIRKSFGIPVHVDAHAREAGLPNTAAAQNATAVPDAAATKPAVPNSPEAPVAVVGSPLSQALDLLLEDSKLAYTVRDEVLLITTKDDERSLRTVRVYPVGDLIGGDFDKDGVDEEYGRLLDVITRSVDPDSWASLDKPKSGNAYISYLPTGRAVICTQTRADHEHVAEIVAKLRKAIGEQPASTAAALSGAGGSEKEGSHPLSMKIYKLNADLPADDFVAVVKDLIEPKSWAGEAYIHGVPGAIVVKQTGAIQKRVEKMLIDLNAIPDPKKSPPSGTPTLVGKRRTI